MLPSLCSAAHDEDTGSSQTEKETEKVDTVNAPDDACAAVLQTDRFSDVDGAVSEPSQGDASCTTTTEVFTTHDQQCSGDDKAISGSHSATDRETQDHDNHATAVDAELSSRAVLQDSDTGVGSAVDEVKPGDVERLLAAVDSATSVAGSLYSNVDPLTAALEFSSAGVSADLLSNKPSTESTSHQADSVANDQEMDGQVLEPSLLPHSSSSLELPVSCSVAITSTSCPAPDCSSADVLKQDSGSLACSSVSATPDADAGKDMEMAIDEPPLTVLPTSRSNVLAASQDVLLLDEGVDGNKPLIVHDQVSVSCTNEESSSVELSNRNDNSQYSKENEMASSDLNQLTESCFQLNNTSASLSGPDASNMQMDGTSALHAASVKTNSDNISFDLTSGDVLVLDESDDQPCSCDDAGQSASIDSRSLLTVPSDADPIST